jgi:hypothetical protein
VVPGSPEITDREEWMFCPRFGASKSGAFPLLWHTVSLLHEKNIGNLFYLYT